ncbi:hypothetical protein HDU82_001586 [Entophlyctis luteolus]|nr:hypothetical protein HDU82_001586 [Entophlyctis luteolus]
MLRAGARSLWRCAAARDGARRTRTDGKQRGGVVVDSAVTSESTVAAPRALEDEDTLAGSPHPEIAAENQKRTANAALAQVVKRVARDAFVAGEKVLSDSPDSADAIEKRFLLRVKQTQRHDAALNPSSGVSPGIAHRPFLEGPRSQNALAAKSPFKIASVVRAQHAKSDAETYKTPTQQLFEDYMTIRPTIESFDSLVEQRIAAAQRAGEFDDLPGKGKPIRFDSDDRLNVHVSDTEFIMNNMLKAQNVLPGWIELGKDILGDTEKLRQELRQMHQDIFHETSRTLAPPSPVTSSFLTRWFTNWSAGSEFSRPPEQPHISYDSAGEWERRGREWAQLRIAQLNRKIDDYNIQSPGSVTKRARLSVDEEMARAAAR